MIYAVYALKKGKREPWYDSKGNIVDDGENIEIVLNRSDNKDRLKMFKESIEKNVDMDDWKIWIDEYKK